VLFLLDLPRGEEVTILAQKKKDGKPMDMAFMYLFCWPMITYYMVLK